MSNTSLFFNTKNKDYYSYREYPHKRGGHTISSKDLDLLISGLNASSRYFSTPYDPVAEVPEKDFGNIARENFVP
jgi:hypothetical protein